MSGRWGFILGLAGIGFFLYSAMHPGSSKQRSVSPFGTRAQTDAGEPAFGHLSRTWQETQNWKGFSFPSLSGAIQGHKTSSEGRSRHDLDSQTTIYIGQGAPSGSIETPENPVIALVKSLFPKAQEAGPRKGSYFGRSSPKAGAVPSGAMLRGRVVRDAKGPGGQIPVYVSIPPQSVGALRIDKRFEIMGFPEGLTGDGRLKIRFVKALYPGGFEAQLAGYALSGGREGVPVRISDHMASNMSRSFGRDSLMLGGEAVGSAGWAGGGSLADILAMEEGGTLLYEAQNGIAPENRQSEYVLDRQTPIDVLVVQGFPLPDSHDLRDGK
jgi:hypothetical protein